MKWTGKFDKNGCFIAKQKSVFPTNYKISAALRLEEGKKLKVGRSYTVDLPGNVVDITKVYTPEQADEDWLSVIDPFNGLNIQVPIGDFRPIGVLKDDDASLYHQHVQ